MRREARRYKHPRARLSLPFCLREQPDDRTNGQWFKFVIYAAYASLRMCCQAELLMEKNRAAVIGSLLGCDCGVLGAFCFVRFAFGVCGHVAGDVG